MSKISRCEVCGGTKLEDALDLGKHPMCDDLVAVGDTRRAEEYPITILFCDTCKTAHQAYQIPKRTLFPASYHYRARHTADVLDGMKQLVERVADVAGSLDGLTVLDIGCNDGSLLSFFAKQGARTLGVEPTGAAADAREAGHTVYNDYFAPALAATIAKEYGQPDIITFTNVFAHIEDLQSVLEAVRLLIGPQTLLVIENHYFGAVLDRAQFDTFYHEHPRTYSLTSFRYIADALGAGLASVEFPQRYGGNIRVMLRAGAGKALSADAAELSRLPKEENFGARLREMGMLIPRWRREQRAVIAAAVANFGPLPGKAFPGRAAILVKLLDLDETMVSAVYEKPGSMKIGHYVPGTRIPILSDDEFESRPRKDAPLINLAWHISTEIHGYLRSRGFSGEIIDLFNAEEFAKLAQPSSAVV